MKLAKLVPIILVILTVFCIANFLLLLLLIKRGIVNKRESSILQQTSRRNFMSKVHTDYNSTKDTIHSQKSNIKDSNLISVRVAESCEIYEGFISPFVIPSTKIQLQKSQKQNLTSILTKLKHWDELDSNSKSSLVGEVKRHYISIVSDYFELVINDEFFEKNKDFFVRVFKSLLDNQNLTKEKNPYGDK